MYNCIGIRKENPALSEKRAPISPYQVLKLVNLHGVHVIVEPNEKRIFSDEDYEKVGAEISTDLSHCNIIFGVKEIPLADLLPKQTYSFFSHTVKGQRHNMPMLQEILNKNNTLLDYELVTDNNNKRLIFFGNFAGYAGMINSLWALGQRLSKEGQSNPFDNLRQTYRYDGLEEARRALSEAGDRLRRDGMPEHLTPFIVGFTGYGQVSTGAQDVFDQLPTRTLTPEALPRFFEKGEFDRFVAYKVVFKEEHMFAANPYQGKEKPFNLKEYFSNPERYYGVFERYVPMLSMIINGIYWTPQCPRLVTRAFLKEHFQNSTHPRLRVIGDISCDIEGSIEMTVKATGSDNPVYVYDPITDEVSEGFEGRGPVVMAVDKLPAELPRESSEFFGNALLPFIPNLATADFFTSWDRMRLPREFRRSIIVHRGKLTRNFSYLKKYLEPEDQKGTRERRAKR